MTGLGSFIEIEAISTVNKIREPQLRTQCNHYMQLFGINPKNLIDSSYSDMLMQK